MMRNHSQYNSHCQLLYLNQSLSKWRHLLKKSSQNLSLYLFLSQLQLLRSLKRNAIRNRNVSPVKRIPVLNVRPKSALVRRKNVGVIRQIKEMIHTNH
jgi:hypothetical protein